MEFWKHIFVLLLIGIVWHFIMQAMSDRREGPGVFSLEQQEYYDKVFTYAMQTLPKDGSYSWQGNGASGTITAGGGFTSPLHAFCRSYTEILMVNGLSGSGRGYGCRRADGATAENTSWCRLQQGNALTCAMEPGVEDAVR